MIAVLFARADSNYRAHAQADVYDIDRDARTWAGGTPVVAHPPCRGWGRLRAFAKPRPDEKALALFAVDRVRTFGGVLEHPECSSLWSAAGLPHPGCGADSFGGWTLPIDQSWWGHRARKRTWLYIVGVQPGEVPVMPLSLARPSHVVAQCRTRSDGSRKRSGDLDWRPELDKAEREHTPPALAAWLLDLAARCTAVRA